MPRAIDRLDLDAAKKRFGEVVAAELARGITPGFSVAWVVDGQLVHAAGYGLADWEKKLPATADTIYRAGSISKLFNAMAAMQLVEQGKLDLDAPIERALPDFLIEVPFAGAGPLTARQMLCHRSGMIREAPVGGYLDPSQPTDRRHGGQRRRLRAGQSAQHEDALFQRRPDDRRPRDRGHQRASLMPSISSATCWGRWA